MTAMTGGRYIEVAIKAGFTVHPSGPVNLGPVKNNHSRRWQLGEMELGTTHTEPTKICRFCEPTTHTEPQPVPTPL